MQTSADPRSAFQIHESRLQPIIACQREVGHLTSHDADADVIRLRPEHELEECRSRLHDPPRDKRKDPRGKSRIRSTPDMKTSSRRTTAGSRLQYCSTVEGSDDQATEETNTLVHSRSLISHYAGSPFPQQLANEAPLLQRPRPPQLPLDHRRSPARCIRPVSESSTNSHHTRALPA